MNSTESPLPRRGPTDLVAVLTAIRPDDDLNQVWDPQDQQTVRARITGRTRLHTATTTELLECAEPADDTALSKPPTMRRAQRPADAEIPWSRKRGTALLAAAALVATVVTVSANLTSATSAFADYSSTPAKLTPAESEAQVTACRSLLNEPADIAIVSRQDIAAAEPVVVDQRGSWTHTVLVTSAAALKPAALDCMINSTQNKTAGVSINDVPPELSRDPSAGITLLSGGSTSGSDGQSAASLFGRVAGDVVAIYVDLPDGQRIDAAISNGWWSAWWPGELPDREKPLPVTFRNTTGAVETVNFNKP